MFFVLFGVVDRCSSLFLSLFIYLSVWLVGCSRCLSVSFLLCFWNYVHLFVAFPSAFLSPHWVRPEECTSIIYLLIYLFFYLKGCCAFKERQGLLHGQVRSSTPRKFLLAVVQAHLVYNHDIILLYRHCLPHASTVVVASISSLPLTCVNSHDS